MGGMLARDWYYTQRRQLGLDSAVASIYDRHDDSDIRARAALTMLVACTRLAAGRYRLRQRLLAVEAADGRGGRRERYLVAGDAGARQYRCARPAGSSIRTSRRAC